MTRALLTPMLAAMLIGVFATPSARADPPSWAPAHGHRAKHRYVYYPSAEVYYAPARHTWFWMSGNGWQAGVNLPGDLRAYVGNGGVHVELNVERPYLRHAYVVDHYGGHPRRHHSRAWHHEHDRGEHHGHESQHRHGHHRG